MTRIRISRRATLNYAAKIFVVYLKTLRLPYTQFATCTRVLRHFLTFYGPDFLLKDFNGERMLQYADLYNPYDDNRTTRERGVVFWKFMHFLKKNEMIPEWTAPPDPKIPF